MNTSFVHPAIEKASRLRSRFTPEFEDCFKYDSHMLHAYSRTVYDVDALGSNLKILEIGSFAGTLSCALTLLGNDVTASDIPFVLEDSANADFYRTSGIKTIPHNLSRENLENPGHSRDNGSVIAG